MANHSRFREKQQQLREEVQLRERRIHELTDGLGENFGKIALNSFMSSGKNKGSLGNSVFSVIASIASRLMSSNSFSRSKSGFSGTWQVVAAGLAFRFIRKMMRKKKDS